MIEIKTTFQDWKEVDAETARDFITSLKKRITNMPESKKNNYINENRLRGITVEELLGRRGKTESTE